MSSRATMISNQQTSQPVIPSSGWVSQRHFANTPRINAAPTIDGPSLDPSAGAGFSHDIARIRVRSDEETPRSVGVQTKLLVNRPGDRYEQEADRVADQVMRMQAPHLQRQIEPEEEEEEALQAKPQDLRITFPVQRQADPEEEKEEEIQAMRLDDFQVRRVFDAEDQEGPDVILQAKRVTRSPPPLRKPLIASVRNVVGKPGSPLPGKVRRKFEPRFGFDFSRVRIHHDRQAAETAREIRARAFTLGHHIVFGPGRFEPGTGPGDRLIAHELTHVLQQRGPGLRSSSSKSPQIQTHPGQPSIQRAVTYTGASVRHDIDPIQPDTAPAGNETALGHTAMLVNGTDVQSLSPEEKIDLLFPLPGFATLTGTCFLTQRTINMNVQNRVRIMTPHPWSRTIAKSNLNTLFGGALDSPSACGGSDTTTVRVEGSPSDIALRGWVLQGEMQHARDDACLVNRYLKSYERAVGALPDSMPRGYLGFGSCASRLEEQLDRTERARTFFRDWRNWGQEYDGPGGSHNIVARTRIAPGCSRVTLTIQTGALQDAGRTCSAWSPP